MDRQTRFSASETGTRTPEKTGKPSWIKRLWKYVLCPLTVLLAVLGVLMFVVNVSPGFAAACGKLPVIGKLTEALRFTKYRPITVDNEYCQALNLSQTRGDNTVRVDFLVVDQQAVTVFYHLETDEPERYYLSGAVRLSDGSEAYESCEMAFNSYKEGPLAGMESVTLIVPDELPPTLQLQFGLYDLETPAEERRPESFDFLLRYDPTLTAPGRHYAQDQTVVLDRDQEAEKVLHITGVDVFTDHVTIDVEGDPSNGSWYHYIDYRVRTPEGLTVEADDPNYNNRDTFYGTGFTFEPDGGVEKAVLRLDSVLLNDASSLTLEILEFSYHTPMEPSSPRVDLTQGRAEGLPEGIELIRAVKEGDDWLLTFRCEDEGLPEKDYFVAYDSFERPCCYFDWIYGGNSELAAAVEDLPPLRTGQYQIARLKAYPYDAVYLTRLGGIGVYLTNPIRVTIPLN